LEKIAKNCDHNIDRWTHFPDLKRAKTETIDCHLRKKSANFKKSYLHILARTSGHFETVNLL
jgi:hypothetical protein